MSRRLAGLAHAAVIALVLGAATARAVAEAPRHSLASVQGMLAVQRLDGWLLYDRAGQNPIAAAVVRPAGAPQRPWFYLIPDKGQPLALVHSSEGGSFVDVPGKKLFYSNYQELDAHLRSILKGKRSVAMEYSPKGQLPSISRVDAGTLELVRAAGVVVRSSEGLVQLTKAVWGDDGRKAHYVAVHHLTELRREALAAVAKQLAAGATISELDVQQRIVKGMQMRGLVGPPPVVASGRNSADPYYVPSPQRAANIVAGDVLVISIAGRLDTGDGIYAVHTWVAYIGSKVPDRIARIFDVVALARDEALALIGDRLRRHRAVQGYEVDQAARRFVAKAGYGDRFLHRTGHSLDHDLLGAGADLDDHELRDRRPLMKGTGFTVGPGIYLVGELGVRAEVSVYLGKDGLEVTTPVQERVETLVGP